MTRQILHPLLALLACATRQELARQVAYLKEENRILRARLPKRIVTTPAERRRLLKVGRKLGTQLKELMSIVSYGSFHRWIREAEARRNATAATKPKRRGGRPKTDVEIRELILQIRSDTGYGFTKIRQELAKLGIRLSRQTVKNILVAAGHDPMPPGGVDSWDAFLQRHAQTLFQCDFLTKPMWTLKGMVDLYLIVFIHLGTRRIWVTPCTTQPDSAWVAQQGREFLMQAEEMGLEVKQVIHDRDTKFTAQFDAVLTTAGAKVQKTLIRSPNLQAHVERVVQTLKHEVRPFRGTLDQASQPHRSRRRCLVQHRTRAFGAVQLAACVGRGTSGSEYNPSPGRGLYDAVGRVAEALFAPRRVSEMPTPTRIELQSAGRGARSARIEVDSRLVPT